MAAPLDIPLILLGGGGHALVVIEALRTLSRPILGLYDDDPLCAAALPPEPVPVLGPLEKRTPVLDHPWVLCLGDLPLRAALIARLRETDNHASTPHASTIHAPAEPIVHPTAWIAPSAHLGMGCFVGPMAVVQARARVGAHAILNTSSIVEHECVIGENCHLGPRSVLGGSVQLGSGSLVGIGATVLPGIRIGDGCLIGAGSVVRAEIPDAQRVAGVPARPL